MRIVSFCVSVHLLMGPEVLLETDGDQQTRTQTQINLSLYLQSQRKLWNYFVRRTAEDKQTRTPYHVSLSYEGQAIVTCNFIRT